MKKTKHTGSSRILPFFLLIGFLALIVAVMSIIDMFSQKPNDGSVWLLGYEEVKIVDVVPDGPADRAGLKKGDIILGIANRIVTSPTEAAKVLIQQEVGSTVPYLIQRGNDILNYDLILDTYRTADFRYAYYSILGFVFFIVGLYIFLRKPHEGVAQLFYMMCLAFMLFLVCNLRRSSYYWIDLFVQNAGALSLFLLPAFFLHFFLIFPQRKNILGKRRYLLYLIYIIPPVLHIRFTIHQLFGLRRSFEALDINLINWSLLGLYLILGIGSLIHSYVYAQDPVNKRQIKMLLWGTTMGLTPFLIFGVLFVSVFHNTDYLFLGVFPMALIPFSFGYSIVRYRLMDIDVIIKRSLVYTVLTGFLLGVYILLVNVAGELFQRVTGVESFVVVFLSVIIIAILFAPARERIQKFIDRTFYRKDYDFHQTIETLTEKMNSFGDLDRLLEFIFHETHTIMQTHHAALLFMDSESKRFTISLIRGLPNSFTNTVAFDCDDITVLLGPLKDRPMSWEEISAKREFKQLPQNTLSNLIQLKAALSIPLILKDEVLGVMVLGEKRSGDIFSTMDREWLSTLAGRAALAIQNIRLVESLARAKEKLFHAEKLASLGQLASGMAHEIRNPLTAIKMNLQSLSKEISVTPISTRRFEIALSEVDRLENLVQDILNFAKPTPLKVQPVNVHTVLDNTLRLFNDEIMKKDIQMRKSFSPDVPIITADQDKLNQIFLNLLLNAVQALDKGGKIHLTTQVISKNEREMVRIDISDDGSGISENNKINIFNPFFTTRAEGTGLGLTNSLKFAQQHHGTIEVNSKRGRGTTFSVFLPRTQDKEVVL